MCSTCIFHKGNKMQLKPGRVRGMVDDCKRCRLGHFYATTQSGNTLDMAAKGRGRSPRLVIANLEEIRESTEPSHIVAARLGVSPSTVQRARRIL